MVYTQKAYIYNESVLTSYTYVINTQENEERKVPYRSLRGSASVLGSPHGRTYSSQFYSIPKTLMVRMACSASPDLEIGPGVEALSSSSSSLCG